MVKRGLLGFFHNGALGDFIVCLHVVEGIMGARPGSRAVFWSKPSYKPLLCGRGYLRSLADAGDVQWLPFYHPVMFREAPLPPMVKECDEIFFFAQNGGRDVACRLAERARRPVHWLRSFLVTNRSMGRHVVDLLYDQLRDARIPAHRMGLPESLRLVEKTALGREISGQAVSLHVYQDPPLSLGLKAGAKARKEAETLLERLGGSKKPIALFHPGSGGFRKIWPLARWKALGDRLIRKAFHLLVLLGPAEEGMAKAIRACLKGPGYHILDGFSLEMVMALLELVSVYVGNDSGISHLAAAVDSPAVAIFGPTFPEMWSPVGRNVVVVRDGWKEEEILSSNAPHPPSVDAVESAVDRAMGKSWKP